MPLDERVLSAVAVGGQVHEDLMDQIWDISPIDLPFTDIIMSGTSENHYKEFVEEQLAAASEDNAQIDGADITDDDTVTGQRKGNYHQISTKRIPVSDRARNVNTVGARDELLRQVQKRQKDLRRDVEARLTCNKPAVAGVSDTTASECAGIGAWIGSSDGVTNNTHRGATGTDPTLSGTTGGYPNAGPGAGTKEALSEANIKTVLEGVYLNGGDVQYAMSVPSVIQAFSDFLFSSSARVATLQSNVPQGNRTMASSGNGAQDGGVVAQGSVNVYVTNYGRLILTPNRFQPDSATGAADLFLIDPDLWEVSYLQGYRLKELATNGLAENRLISVDYTLCGLAERGNGVVADIDYTLAMTA